MPTVDVSLGSVGRSANAKAASDERLAIAIARPSANWTEIRDFPAPAAKSFRERWQEIKS